LRTERGAQSAARTASRIAPPDALGSEAVEGHAPRLVVAASGLHQAERTGGGELFPVDVAGEVHRHLEDHVPHQRQVILDQLLGFAVRLDRHLIALFRC
jgi:hypothetical protein